MSRTAVKLAAAMLAAGLAVSACGTVKMGAAAITGNSRISAATLTAQVANLDAAYQSNTAKGIKPQRAVGQKAQQVLSWLIVFRIYDELAAQHSISVTPAQTQSQLSRLSAQAAQSKVTLPEYVSAAGALPPDLLPELGRYFAIQSALASKLDGGKAPASAAAQSQLSSEIGHQQCLAAKSLGVTVNPQYGEFDYASYAVVLAPPTLAANPSPTASSSPVVLKPPC
ncbi:MAG: hypothetical protein ACLQFR_10090 [Streptosporangiaceae bacterium]